jgi:hypothetical protein
MNIVMIILTAMLIVGCGNSSMSVEDSEHVAYVSIATTWQEICEDRFNKYDYPDLDEMDYQQAECRRKFASGEEELDIPELPNMPDMSDLPDLPILE